MSRTVWSIVIVCDNFSTLGTVVLSAIKVKAAVSVSTGTRLAEEPTCVVKGILCIDWRKDDKTMMMMVMRESERKREEAIDIH